MKFKPHDHVIDLLVGQRFYTSPEPAVRELLQNAEDACALQQVKDADYDPQIVVRYSLTENYFEVTDNGLGMNSEAVELSFAAVGAPKDDVSHIRELMQQGGAQRQIAQFGIGVLSCFGVADEITVTTKMDDQGALTFNITDYHEEFDVLDSDHLTRGTTVRLKLKAGGPMHASTVPDAVTRYARHAEHVTLHDVDRGVNQEVVEQWQGADQAGAKRINADVALRDGVIALDDAWNNINAGFQSRLVVCNCGFLVSEREINLLPQQMVGYVGEIDVQPGQLNILLNREGFQHDEAWQALGQRLAGIYNELIEAQVSSWEAALEAGDAASTSGEERSIERGVILLTRGQPRGVLQPDVLERLDAMAPKVARVKLWDSEQMISVSAVIERARDRGKVYFVRQGEAATQLQQSVRHGTGAIQITETAETEVLRATFLRLKGAAVIACRQRSYSYQIGDSNQALNVHDADLLAQECGKAGLQFIAVKDAPAEDVDLGAAKESVLISGLLGLDTLNLVTLAGTQDRVVRDYAGRLVNCAHPEVREILAMLPDSVGNPVWRDLLQIYMDIDNFALERAQQAVKKLLVSKDLHEQAQIPTGRLLSEHLRAKLTPLIQDREPTQ